MWLWTRANNTLSGACRAPPMQRQTRPPFLRLTQKSSEVSLLGGPLNLAHPKTADQRKCARWALNGHKHVWQRLTSTGNSSDVIHLQHPTGETSTDLSGHKNTQKKLQNAIVASFSEAATVLHRIWLQGIETSVSASASEVPWPLPDLLRYCGWPRSQHLFVSKCIYFKEASTERSARSRAMLFAALLQCVIKKKKKTNKSRSIQAVTGRVPEGDFWEH